MSCQLVNNTPFRAHAVPHAGAAGRGVLLIVKGSWQLSGLAQAAPRLEPAERQLPIYPTGLRQTLGSLDLDETQRRVIAPRLAEIWERFETDNVPPKPCFDVIVNAWAVSPDGRPRPRIDAAVDYTQGKQQRRLLALHAHAPRIWQAELGAFGRLVPTLLAPAWRVPLLRPFAYGGVAQQDDGSTIAFEPNPEGMGFYGSRQCANGAVLPWVESTDAALQHWDDGAQPVALGHLPPHHLPRRDLQGSFGPHWQRTRAPHLPLDFDPRHHNAAPQALQLAQGPRAGDRLTLHHMADQSQLHFCWPSLRLSAQPETRGGTRLAPQPLQWDTLIVETDEARATLVWRAVLLAPALEQIGLVTLWAASAT